MLQAPVIIIKGKKTSSCAKNIKVLHHYRYMYIVVPLSVPSPGGGSSYILVYTDIPLEWGTFLTSLIYQWDAIFINLYING
jgi:hypothetical protein